MSDRQDKAAKVQLLFDTVLPIVEAFCQQDVIRYNSELLRQYVLTRIFSARHRNKFPYPNSGHNYRPEAPVVTISKLTLHDWAKDYDREYNKRRERIK